MKEKKTVNPLFALLIIALIAGIAAQMSMLVIGDYASELDTDVAVFSSTRRTTRDIVDKETQAAGDSQAAQAVQAVSQNNDTGTSDNFVETYNSSNDPTITKPERKVLLDTHNEVRAAVGVPALAWSDTLARSAQGWANQLAVENCEIKHSSPSVIPYGENIYYFVDSNLSSSGSDAGTAVELWAAEENFYDYDSNTCQTGKVCGHYTQLVWNASKRLGCGRSTCTSNGYEEVWVCHYDPPGNFIGQWPY